MAAKVELVSISLDVFVKMVVSNQDGAITVKKRVPETVRNVTATMVQDAMIIVQKRAKIKCAM